MGRSTASVADHLQPYRIPVLEAQVKWSVSRIQVVVVWLVSGLVLFFVAFFFFFVLVVCLLIYSRKD